MINPTGASYEPVLTETIQYPTLGAVADIVAPRVEEEYKGTYEIYGKDSFKIVNIQPRVGMGKAATITAAIDTDSFETKNYPLRTELSNEHIYKRAKLGKDARVEKSDQVKFFMDRSREKRVADLFAAVTNTQAMSAYAAESNTLNVYFDDETNANPFKTIGYYYAKFIVQCGVAPNHILMNPITEWVLANHPQRIERDKAKDKITDPRLPEIFMNMKKIVASLTYDASKRGRTESRNFIWGNNLYFMYIADNVNSSSPTASKTFDAGKDKGRTTGVSIAEYPGDAGQNGIYIEGQEDVAEKIVCSDAIFALTSVLENPLSSF